MGTRQKTKEVISNDLQGIENACYIDFIIDLLSVCVGCRIDQLQQAKTPYGEIQNEKNVAMTTIKVVIVYN